jgi:YVTN family beta-propeller protein
MRRLAWQGLGLAAAGVIVASGAWGQAKTPKPGLVVLSKDENRIFIVDPVTLKAAGTEDTGAAPHEVAVSEDGKLAVVTNYGPKHDGTTLSVVDLDKMTTVGQVTYPGLSGPHGIVIQGTKAYFTNEGDKSVVIFDFVANAIDQRLITGQNRPHMLVLSKDGHTLFVSNVESNNISMLVTKDGKGWTQTNINTGKGPEGMDLSADQKELWVANSEDGTVSIINVEKKKVVGKMDVKTKHSNRLKFTPDERLALISDLGNGELVVVDVAARKEVKRLALGKSAEGILVQPDGSRAFVAVSGDDKVAVVDLKTLEVTGTFTVGKDPDGMAWRR